MKRPFALLHILFVAGCSGGGGGTSTASAAAGAVASASGGGSSDAPARGAPTTLPPVGAPGASWKANHDADPKAANAYDFSSELNVDTYRNVTMTEGIVSGFTYSWAKVPLTVAEGSITTNLGADATQLWTTQKDACIEEEWTSPELAKALAPLGDTNGWVLVKLDTAASAGAPASFDPNGINEQVYSLGKAASSSSAPAC